jgi:hypothetical protein
VLIHALRYSGKMFSGSVNVQKDFFKVSAICSGRISCACAEVIARLNSFKQVAASFLVKAHSDLGRSVVDLILRFSYPLLDRTLQFVISFVPVYELNKLL